MTYFFVFNPQMKKTSELSVDSDHQVFQSTRPHGVCQPAPPRRIRATRGMRRSPPSAVIMRVMTVGAVIPSGKIVTVRGFSSGWTGAGRHPRTALAATQNAAQEAGTRLEGKILHPPPAASVRFRPKPCRQAIPVILSQLVWQLSPDRCARGCRTSFRDRACVGWLVPCGEH